MFRLIKKKLVGLLTGIVSVSNHAKCISLSNQKSMIQPTLINLHPNEYNQEFHYYPFAVKLDRCGGSCNTLIYVMKYAFQTKKEDLNLSVFNMITGINESETLTKHISCECKCRFDERKCNSNQRWNNGKCRCECKKRHVCGKDYVWNPTTCNCENGKYLASIMDDSAIMYNEIIDAEANSNDETNFNEKKASGKTQKLYILLAFLLVTIVLLIVVSNYCYLIKYRTKLIQNYYHFMIQIMN